MEILHCQLLARGFSQADFDGELFVRFRTLKKRLAALA
jgi:hypothetical protein